MKATGYILFLIAAGLFAFVGVNAMVFDGADANVGEGAGPVSNVYLWALVPAVGALAAGVYMMLTSSKGYGHTNNPNIQETSWQA